MPCIQKMHQDSQNSGKAEFIEGHNYGQVSAVIANESAARSIPLLTELQASPKKVDGTDKKDGDSLVAQMIALTHRASEAVGEPVYVALAACFSSGGAWAAADRTAKRNGVKLVEIVTRAQTNTVAFKTPEPQKEKKRGQPKKYGDKIVLYGLFPETSKFTRANMVLYGKPAQVRYLCLDLIWKPVKRLVRFVLVKADSGNCIMMSSDLTLGAEDIIAIYALRFKIETSFDEQKNDMGSFAYHFWTTALPKRKKWKPIGLPSDERSQHRIIQAKHAMEAFVCLNTIAAGILTVMAFSHNREIWQYYPGWVRTLRSVIPTIATTKLSLSHIFHAFLPRYAQLPIFCSVVPLLRNDDYLYKFVA
jgi:hypothetical protein